MRKQYFVVHSSLLTLLEHPGVPPASNGSRRAQSLSDGDAMARSAGAVTKLHAVLSYRDRP